MSKNLASLQTSKPLTEVWKLFNTKYFIDNKVQGKLLSWIHDFLETFVL